MKDKYLYYWCWVLVILMLVIIVMSIASSINDLADKNVIEVNVLPKNEDKELVEPGEVRQYVGAMAEREGLNVDRIDKVISCESKYDIYARNGTSTAKGLAQFLDGTWKNNCKGDVFNAQHNTRCFMDNFKKYPSWWSQCL